MLSKSIKLLILFLMLNVVFAKIPGVYTDYVYKSRYSIPSAIPTNLSCQFFFEEQKTCQILDLLNTTNKEKILLSLIKNNDNLQMQEMIRAWNSKMQLYSYEQANFSENQTDGVYIEGQTLKNAWVRTVLIYPSVYDLKDNSFYVPSQIMLVYKSDIDFVIDDIKTDPLVCKEDYLIYGYAYKIISKINDYNTTGTLIPTGALLNGSWNANLTTIFQANGEYEKNIYTFYNKTICEGLNCTIITNCVYNNTKKISDSITSNYTLKIKYYPDKINYENNLAVPKKGFAYGTLKLMLPKDFLKYEIKIKNNFFVLSKNEIIILKRGENYPLLQLGLIPSNSKSGNLDVFKINQTEDELYYYATLNYRIYLETPNISTSDCIIRVYTPFYIKTIENACNPIKIIPNLEMKTIDKNNTAIGKIKVLIELKDQLSNPIEGLEVELSGEIPKKILKTNSSGQAIIEVEQKEQPLTIIGKVVQTEEYAQSKAILIIPGKGLKTQEDSKIKKEEIVGILITIFLILIGVNFLMNLGKGKRSIFIFIIIVLSLVSNNLFSQSDILQTYQACQNYDFDNAIKHFGECAESYRAITEFNGMREAANRIISNIAPLVISTPNIEPYKIAYSNMVAIALALFRVAWAFNSLYLILNIFNPKKRSEALKQYIWLGVFVIFVYASYSLITNAINLVSQLSEWIVGQNAQEVLLQSTINTEFLTENYEMLKLFLPFLNISYLILFSRYILVIALFLLFPFSLLLFFNEPTKGFGKALLTITFMVYILSLINAVLLLIYKILLEIGDTTIQNTVSSTFFSSSFIVLFGFVDLILIIISIVSAVAFIGGK
jgi:hypothetical protein